MSGTIEISAVIIPSDASAQITLFIVFTSFLTWSRREVDLSFFFDAGLRPRIAVYRQNFAP
jgi:hypothetical protein